ncbi:preprotein translocase subunit SecG [Variovorax sp. LjRoot290]|jgi:preprotein translocase subunit SecG|uniref:preprotein translocase subunit SecG n=1 Tax=unclassified Variovorax TaxID=663243 RepID=UPI000881EF42|nr:preprotein translocase subunit SecG [Variovorax sp. CF079]SDC10351.1 protein translocase subunit secG [Variovorax sp. CF079]
MNVVLNILVGVQMLTALAMIGLILIQHGKGADMGAAFGSGSAGSLFGASGSANFLSRTTGVLAAVFFACTLLLAYFSHARPTGGGSLLERATIGAPAPAPAPAPSGPASQIPSGNAPAAAPGTNAPASAPAAPASGAAQIPTK